MNRVERVHQTTHDEIAEGRKKNINSKNTKSIQQFSAGCLSLLLLLLFWYDSHTVTHTQTKTSRIRYTDRHDEDAYTTLTTQTNLTQSAKPLTKCEAM